VIQLKVNTQNNMKILGPEILFHQKVIAKGGNTIENFEVFMEDFQKSRQDRGLERLDIELKTELKKVVEEKGYTEDDFRQMLSA